MQKNRFIVNDIYDARDIVLRKNFKVFTMISRLSPRSGLSKSREILSEITFL